MSDSGSSEAPGAAPGAAPAWAAPATRGAVTDVAVEPPARRLGWTPPPKRGLVPLRPIPLGVVLGAPFRLQRRTPRTTLAPALVVSLVTTSLAALLAWALTIGPQAALDASYYEDFLIAQNLLGVAGAIGGWVPLALAFPATALLAGLVVIPAARSLLAERVTFRGVRWRLTGRWARLLLWSALVFVAAMGVLAAAAVLPLLVAASSPGGVALAFLVAALELLALGTGVGYLAARLGFTSHAIAIDGVGLGAALRRSWALTRRAGWRLYLTQLLIWCIVGLAATLLLLPIGWALDIAVGLIFPNGPTPAEADLYAAGRMVVLSAVTAITGAFGLVVQSVCGALLYLDARMRVEGLDLALARYVDERQRGLASADPFPGGGAR